MPASDSEKKIRENSDIFICNQTENCKGSQKAMFTFVLWFRETVGENQFSIIFFHRKPQKTNKPAISQIINLFIKIVQKMDQRNLDRYQCLVADVTAIEKGSGKGKGRKTRGRRYSQRVTDSSVRPVILWLPLETTKKDQLCRGLTSGAVIYFPGRTCFTQPERTCQCLLQPGEVNLCAIQPHHTYP